MNASAGTTESSDILITIDKNPKNEIEIYLESSVEKQFGRLIRTKIEETLKGLNVTSAKVQAIDKGALDCTIEARTIAAVYRGAGENQVDWKGLKAWNN